MASKAFITGITGQDGSYLSEWLLEQGYEVHGLVRRSSSATPSRLSHLLKDASIFGQRLFFHYADLEDTTTLRRVLAQVGPDEIYHLASQSHAGLSFEIPESTCEMIGMGTLRLLEIIRDLPHRPRLFHASSSEIFGWPAQAPQNEQTPYVPVNPYGCAKAFATHLAAVYRQVFGLFATNGILFNHESPRRGENFVTRKICRAAAAIKLGQQKELALGDTAAQRDWGHARDYVRGMWLSLQQTSPEDFVFATGQLHSVQEVVAKAFAAVGLDWKPYLRLDPRLLRPPEPAPRVGDAAKARRVLGWAPQISFDQMITEMVQAELQALASSS